MDEWRCTNSKNHPELIQNRYRAFSLTWPPSMQIYWNKRKGLHKKRVKLPKDWFGTTTWPPFQPRFIVLGHQYGRRDVMWKHPINLSAILNWDCKETWERNCFGAKVITGNFSRVGSVKVRKWRYLTCMLYIGNKKVKTLSQYLANLKTQRITTRKWWV